MAATDSIQVAIRFRPLIKRERDSCQPTNWKVNKNTISQVSNGKCLPSSSYTFDQVFDQPETTENVYREFAQPILLSVMEGFNGTIFAYGQTSSGKTFTMMGDSGSPGIIPQAIDEIFDFISDAPSREFLLIVSYMEIYNEIITDLLKPDSKNLKIHETAEKTIFVGDLTQTPVSSTKQILDLMAQGERRRHFGETNMNEKSSRSHTVFRMVIESRETQNASLDQSVDPDSIDGAVRVSHLNLIDLAGSERVSATGAEGLRLKEGVNINRSLFTLGSVIAKLSEGESFIPYRDSKLTRILQNSLGGNAKTSILCTVTPASVEETIGTLKFASRAKTIKNCPEVNEVLDDGTLLKRYKKEIRDLKHQIDKISQHPTIVELQSEKEKMEQRLEEQRRDNEEKIKKLTAFFCTSSGTGALARSHSATKARIRKRRETWCPGAVLSKAPLASAAMVMAAVVPRLPRLSSSSSEESPREFSVDHSDFFAELDEEEHRRLSEVVPNVVPKKRTVHFSTQPPRCLPIDDSPLCVEEESQAEGDIQITKLENHIGKLQLQLTFVTKERDELYDLEATRKEVNVLRSEKAQLEFQLTSFPGILRSENTDLREQLKTLENENNLVNSYMEDLQKEVDGLQDENQALYTRVQDLENAASTTASSHEVNSLNEDMKYKNAEIERLGDEADILRKQCKAFEEELVVVKNELEVVVKESTNKRHDVEEIDGLRDRLSKADEELRRLRIEQEDFISSKLRIESLVAENEKVRLQVEVSEGRMLSQCNEKDERIQKLLQDLQAVQAVLKSREDSEGIIQTDVQTQLDKLEVEKHTLEETLQTMTTERDEIRNDLSDAITDSASVQQDLLEAHQRVKRYKIRLEELENDNTDNVNKIAALEEELQNTRMQLQASPDVQPAADNHMPGLEEERRKVQSLIHENAALKLAKQELQDSVDELQRKGNDVHEIEELRTQFASTKNELENITSEHDTLKLLYEELENNSKESNEKVASSESSKDNDELKTQLEEQFKRVSGVTRELEAFKQSNKELQSSKTEIEEKLEELQMSCDTLEKTLSEKDRRYGALRQEFGDYKSVTSMNIDQSEMKKDKECILRDLNDEKKAHEALRKEYESLKDEVENAKVSLLRDSNRDLTQQKTIDKMKSERRETICMQAHIRQEWTKAREDGEKKSSELEQRCRQLISEQDIAEHKVEVACKQVDDIKQQMRDLEQLYSSHNSSSIVPSGGNDKTAQRLKQVEFNLGLTKQKFEKADQRLKELERENRQLSAADVRNGALMEERDVMKTQLHKTKEAMNEKTRKLNELSIEITQIRAHVQKLTAENKKQKAELEKKTDKMEDMEIQLLQAKDAINNSTSVELETCSLRQEIEGLQCRLKSKSHKCEELAAEIKMLQKRNECGKGAQVLTKELEVVRCELDQQSLKYERLLAEYEGLRVQHKELASQDEKRKKVDDEVRGLRESIDKLQTQLGSVNKHLEDSKRVNQELEEQLANMGRKAVQGRPPKEHISGNNDQENVIQELNKTLQIKHEELEHMTFLVDEREVEIDEVNLRLQESQELQQKMTGSLKQKMERVEELMCELELTERELVEAKRELEEAGSNINESRLMIKDQEDELIRVKEELKVGSNASDSEKKDELMCEVELLKHELEEGKKLQSEVQYRNGQLQATLKEQETEMLQTKQELESVKSQSGGSDSSPETTSLIKQLEESKSSLVEAKEHIAKLRIIINEQEEEIFKADEEGDDGNELLTEVERLERELKEVRQSYEEAVQLNTQMRSFIKEQQDEVMRITKELESKTKDCLADELGMKLELLNQEFEESKKSHKDAEDLIVKLKEVMEEQENETIKNKEELISKTTELQDCIEGKENLIEKLRAEIETTRIANRQAESSHDDTHSNATDVQAIVQGYEKKVSSLEKTLEITKVALQVQSNDHSRTENLIMAKQAELEDLQDNLMKAHEENARVKHSLQQRHQQVVEMQELLKSRQKECSDLREKCQSTSGSSEKKYEALKKEVEEITKVMTDGRIQKEDLEEQLESTKRHLNTIEFELKKIHLKKIELEDQLHQAGGSSEDVESLHQSLTASQSENAALHQGLHQLQAELQDKRVELEQQQKALNVAEVDKKTLEGQVDELNELVSSTKKAEWMEKLKASADRELQMRQALNDFHSKLADTEKQLQITAERLQQMEDQNSSKQTTDGELTEKYMSATSELEKMTKEVTILEGMYDNETTRLKTIIDEQQGEGEEYERRIESLEAAVKNSQNATKQTTDGDLTEKYMSAISELEKMTKEVTILEGMFDNETTRLKTIIDEQQGEGEEYERRIESLEAAAKNSQNSTKQTTDGDLTEKYETAVSELEKMTKQVTIVEAEYDNETTRLKTIIDEQQVETEEFERRIESLEAAAKNSQNSTKQTTDGDLTEKYMSAISELEKMTKEVTILEGTYDNETTRLKTIIDEQQGEGEEYEQRIESLEAAAKNSQNPKYEELKVHYQAALNEVERQATMINNLQGVRGNQQDEVIESLRIELAEKNMRIHELVYTGHRQEDENTNLRKDIAYDQNRISKMKNEMRRLREEQDSTVQIKPRKESYSEGDVGVVSSVAVYSLKAKIGQLEATVGKLMVANEKLEKEKGYISLLKTQESTQVTQLTSEVTYLRNKNRELSKVLRKLKKDEDCNEDKPVLAASNRPVCEVESHADSEPAKDAASGSKPAAQAEVENRSFRNWLTPTKTKDMFKEDNPMQCQHQ